MEEPAYLLVSVVAVVAGFVVLYFLIRTAVKKGVVAALDHIANRTTQPTGAHAEPGRTCDSNVIHAAHSYMTFAGPELCPGIER